MDTFYGKLNFKKEKQVYVKIHISLRFKAVQPYRIFEEFR